MRHANDPSGFDLARLIRLDWSGPGSLRALSSARKGSELLGGVEILRLMADEGEEEFLLTVAVTDELVLASPKFRWRDVSPPQGMVGDAAAHHVLGRIDGIAREIRALFAEYTWLRVASELREVHRLLAEIGRN